MSPYVIFIKVFYPVCHGKKIISYMLRLYYLYRSSEGQKEAVQPGIIGQFNRHGKGSVLIRMNGSFVKLIINPIGRFRRKKQPKRYKGIRPDII